MKKLLPLICLIVLTSCSITFPGKFHPDFQPQTDQSLIQFLDSSNVVYNKTDIATLTDTITFKAFGTKNTFTIPDAFFFNKDGYRVEDNFKGTRCGHIITNANKINEAPTNKTEHINDWIKDFRFLQNTATTDKDYDVTIILTWGLYAHKSAPSVNREAFEWYKSLKENYPEMKIRTVFLNLDFQRSWFIHDDNEKKAATGNITQ